jgi:hypothetical protein
MCAHPRSLTPERRSRRAVPIPASKVSVGFDYSVVAMDGVSLTSLAIEQ